MSFAHLHLIMNHIPIIGIPIALLFLLYGIKTSDKSTLKFSLMVLVGLAILVLPVYFTGEPAEDVAENLPGVTKAFIHTHEDSAQISMILTLITGALSAAALWFQNDKKKGQMISWIVVVFAVIASLSLMYTGNLGGQVRHTEFRANTSQ
jgi:uncharacterized membrane protein